MSRQNYKDDREDTSDHLKESDISDDIVKQIINDLPREVKHKDLEDNHDLKATDLKDSNIVYSHDSGKINLNSAKLIDVKNLDALIFNTSPDQKEGVDLLMNKGHGADAFKGAVVTHGGDDTIKLSGKGVKVASGDGKDTVTTGNGHDIIDSGNGNDSINSGKGNDSIESGKGDDNINSGAGNDKINAGTGNDTLTAGTGNDTVEAGAGNDSIYSGTGDDKINAGSGNDTVVMGSGKDSVNLGSGVDILKLAAGYTGTAKLDGGSQKDTLDLSLADIANVQLTKGHLIVTLNNGSVIDSVNFEKFIYDDNGTDAGGFVEITGVKAFDALDFLG